MRLAQVLTVSVLTLAMTAEVYAERRPGLGGKYAARNMTAAQGSLSILAGPTSSQILGVGFVSVPESKLEAAAGPGLNITMYNIEGADLDTPLTFGFGSAFGITPELEAGFFLPILLSPDFELKNPSVFTTYAMDMGNFDIGGRLAVTVPAEENSKVGFTVGVPFLFRAGNSRIDAGIFAPIVPGGKKLDDGEEAMRIDLAIPVRFTQSVTPKIFVGIETGLYLPKIETEEGFVPVSIHGGYTLLAGGNVVDIALSAGLPFALILGENGPDTTDFLTLQLGTNVQMKF